MGPRTIILLTNLLSLAIIITSIIDAGTNAIGFNNALTYFLFGFGVLVLNYLVKRNAKIGYCIILVPVIYFILEIILYFISNSFPNCIYNREYYTLFIVIFILNGYKVFNNTVKVSLPIRQLLLTFTYCLIAILIGFYFHYK